MGLDFDRLAEPQSEGLTEKHENGCVLRAGPPGRGNHMEPQSQGSAARHPGLLSDVPSGNLPTVDMRIPFGFAQGKLSSLLRPTNQDLFVGTPWAGQDDRALENC